MVIRLVPASARSFASLCVLAALGACSVDDRVLTETEGEAGDGTGGTTGGSGGGAGQGGTGGTNSAGKGGTGTAGKGGTSSGGKGGTGGAGRGGTGGTGGAGKGGTGGAGKGGASSGPVDCDGDPLDVDMDVVKACLLQASCHPYLPTTSISTCVTYQTLRAFTQGDCGTSSDDCADFRACSGYGYYGGTGCTSTVEALCEENTGVLCSGEFSVEFDCDPGTTCEVLAGADRDTVGCRHPDACTEADDTRVCDGNLYDRCLGGVRYGGDCAASGAMCEANEDGTTSCLYVTSPCDTPGTVECGATDRIDFCTDAGSAILYNCAPGLGCTPGDATAWCLAPGCTPTTPCEESCTGAELTLCYGSIPVTVDCRDYGLTQCIESTLTDGMTTIYRCGVPS
jgi:hypothetical protein